MKYYNRIELGRKTMVKNLTSVTVLGNNIYNPRVWMDLNLSSLYC